MNGKIYNVIFACIGVVGLLLTRYYSGSNEIIIHSFGANITFSFGAYFIVKLFNIPFSLHSKILNGGIVFLGVSLQEIAQGLHLYSGMFDPLDFLFNAIGIIIAIFVDTLLSKKIAIKK